MLEVDRVGVDIDSHSGLSGLVCCLRAAVFGDATYFYTKRGFHVEVALDCPVGYNVALDIRRMLGDCPDRLRIDEERLSAGHDIARFDTLFEVRLKDGKTYSRREIRPLSCGPWPDV